MKKLIHGLVLKDEGAYIRGKASRVIIITTLSLLVMLLIISISQFSVHSIIDYDDINYKTIKIKTRYWFAIIVGSEITGITYEKDASELIKRRKELVHDLLVDEAKIYLSYSDPTLRGCGYGPGIGVGTLLLRKMKNNNGEQFNEECGKLVIEYYNKLGKDRIDNVKLNNEYYKKLSELIKESAQQGVAPEPVTHQ